VELGDPLGVALLSSVIILRSALMKLTYLKTLALASELGSAAGRALVRLLQ
jgi:hypothetical protein